MAFICLSSTLSSLQAHLSSAGSSLCFVPFVPHSNDKNGIRFVFPHFVTVCWWKELKHLSVIWMHRLHNCLHLPVKSDKHVLCFRGRVPLSWICFSHFLVAAKSCNRDIKRVFMFLLNFFFSFRKKNKEIHWNMSSVKSDYIKEWNLKNLYFILLAIIDIEFW